MTPQRTASSDMSLPAPWKEVAHPATGAVYYWNTLTSETTWTRPHDPSHHVGNSTCDVAADSSNVDTTGSGPQTLRERVETWVDGYSSCKGVQDRLSAFFRGLSLIRAGVEEQAEIHEREQRDQALAIEKLIIDALSSLEDILRLASAGTRSYNKFVNYKSQLQHHKRAICNNSYITEDVAEQIRDICEEVLTVSENLKALSHSTKRDDGSSHVTSLCDDYSVYMKRKKQCSTRSRWKSFIQSRKTTQEYETTDTSPTPPDQPNVVEKGSTVPGKVASADKGNTNRSTTTSKVYIKL